MAKPKVYDAAQIKARKIKAQRLRRQQLKAEGKNPYKKQTLSEEVKAINKIVRKEKQRIWLDSEDGVLFLKRQSERHKKYTSPDEQRLAYNERERVKRATSLYHNLYAKMMGAKDRAKKYNIPFDLDIDYLLSIYKPVCPYLDVELTLMNNKPGNGYSGISIDKIIPELGYTKGNVQIISFKANVMKQDVDLNTLRLFAKKVLEIHGDLCSD